MEIVRFVESVVAPLNRSADVARLQESVEELRRCWMAAVRHGVEHGGQGLPKLIATADIEMLNSADILFALCSLLSDEAIKLS